MSDTIVTDNSAVIASLNERIAEHVAKVARLEARGREDMQNRIEELEATVDYMERSHNKIVGLILDIDELEQDTDEMSEAQQDLLAIAQNSAVYGVPPKYRDISGRKRIDELEARLEIDTLNPNRREHIVQLTSRIDAVMKHIEERYDSQEPWTTPEEVKAILRGGLWS